MEQYGIVTEAKEGRALVNLQRQEACASCGRCGILSGAGKKDIIVEALNPLQAEAGQCVLLESDDRQIIFISFMLYFVPVLALLAGIILMLFVLAPAFNIENYRELFAAGTGFLMMLIVFFCVRLWDKRLQDRADYKPVITALLKDGAAENSGLAEEIQA